MIPLGTELEISQKHDNVVKYKASTVEEIREARKKRPVVYMFTAFGDESHDPKQERVFAIAAVIGTQEEWDDLEPIWSSRNNGIPFHSTDCDSGYGIYKGMPKDELNNLYKDLVNIIVNTKLMGHGFAIDLNAYKTFFPDNVNDVAYYLCFRNIVTHFAKLAYYDIYKRKVKFVFHRNTKIEHTAGVLYDTMVNSFPDWKYSPALHDEIAFASDQTVGIQVADLLARETFKFVDSFVLDPDKNIGKPARKSIKALSDTNRFSFEFYSKSYFEDFRNKFQELEVRTGMSHHDYHLWLKSKKLKTDNFSNRVAYFADVIEKEKSSGINKH